MRTVEQIKAELKVARLEAELVEARSAPPGSAPDSAQSWSVPKALERADREVAEQQAKVKAGIDRGENWGGTGAHYASHEYAEGVRSRHLRDGK